jgi:hypothetical protein
VLPLLTIGLLPFHENSTETSLVILDFSIGQQLLTLFLTKKALKRISIVTAFCKTFLMAIKIQGAHTPNV